LPLQAFVKAWKEVALYALQEQPTEVAAHDVLQSPLLFFISFISAFAFEENISVKKVVLPALRPPPAAV
jgi:hypothetical protein